MAFLLGKIPILAAKNAASMGHPPALLRIIEEFRGVRNVGAMTKKKAKGKKAEKTGKKSAKRKSTPRKQADAEQVHETISGMVKSGAKKITAAVMVQACHGDLAPAKYLLEMAGIYPRATDGSQATTEEDCLAKTLLDRLNAPRKPGEVEDGANADGELPCVESAEGEETPGSSSAAGSE
jgi:hypothetical protein